MEEVREEHNLRALHEDCLSYRFLPAPRLAEVRAAYGLPPCGDTQEAREELHQLLASAPWQRDGWSKERLEAHRKLRGGDWRKLSTRKREQEERAEQEKLEKGKKMARSQ